ncbi:glucosaminidase domain-containing protein [Paenibacillus sp. N1-5-1-14]|uniref:glycoside hydrolase family 73 protein n=1 Tax=Paenibacillus radicibacter TaxID=2972488 RepID=UPI0021598FBA|nr:glucosaminidase domain-containing protein [Paenibacillus radicibacter]MCR8641874.1 glucosaminidase domain-containing protein [Paenibacillus radicibacter]
MTPSDFFAQIAPIAKEILLEGSTIFASLRIAQSAHETGWQIPSWRNLGGYKVGSGKPNSYWRGTVVNKGTWEVYDGRKVNIQAAFRAYDSIEDFYRDQDLLFENSRYDRVRKAKTANEQAQMLQACGYATDPKYAAKLIALMDMYDLHKYDEEVVEVSEKITQLETKIAELEKRLSDMEAKQTLSSPPDWAQEAVKSAVNTLGANGKPILSEPNGGSYDFYRVLTVLHRKGLI